MCVLRSAFCIDCAPYVKALATKPAIMLDDGAAH